MEELKQFQLLKKRVLLEYQKEYPYFNGSWKNFSSRDIQNLIDLIETKQKQKVSEKWIYTHLKPESNSKLPRKDMLDIFSRFVGFSGWDEFIFEKSEPAKPRKSKPNYWMGIGCIVGLFLLAGFIYFFSKKEKPITNIVELKDEYTQEKIKGEEIKVYQEKENQRQPLVVKNSQVQIEEKQGEPNTKIIIESPYYKKKTIILNETSGDQKKIIPVHLKPDDYAMMLKAFMFSDIKDWETRKEQLNKILSEELEVIVMLKNDLGAEYFNKKEFSEKLIIPSESVKKMKIIQIENDEKDKIKFIRIKQE